MDLFQNRKVLSLKAPSAILEFILEGTPDVRESVVDSKRDVDFQLKRSCQSLISHAASRVTGPVYSFLGDVDKFLNPSSSSGETSSRESAKKDSFDFMTDEDKTRLMKEDFMEAENVARVVAEAVRNAKVNISAVLRSLRLYLANKDTEMILYRPIKVNFFLPAFFPLFPIFCLVNLGDRCEKYANIIDSQWGANAQISAGRVE